MRRGPSRSDAGGAAGGALVRASHVARNALLDLRHGRPLASPKNTDYRALDQIFEGRLEAHDVLIDVGCGRGRVLNWWIDNTDQNRAVGVELDPVRARRTARRLRRHGRVSVVPGDALDVMPDDGSIVYMFNPAGRTFIAQMESRLRRLPALRLVLYYNPKHLAPFEQSGHWTSDVTSLTGHPRAPYSELAVLTPRRGVPESSRPESLSEENAHGSHCAQMG